MAKFAAMPFRRRLRLYVAALALVVGLMLSAMLVAWAIPLGDFAPVLPVPRFGSDGIPIQPERQVEKHTCGLHAVSSIYRSYGLDPAERRLRARLGVDTRSLIYDSSTTGSLHPDVYRVLEQDGFDMVALDPATEGARDSLTHHLAGGRLALALVQRRESGNMHWVVFCGFKEGALSVCDSLRPDIYSEEMDDYWNRCVLSVALLNPHSDRAQPAVWKTHVAGVRDMYAAFALKRPPEVVTNRTQVVQVRR